MGVAAMAKFNDNVQLDPSQIEDRRGASGGFGRGGGMSALPGGRVAVGGGSCCVVIIVLIVAVLLGVNPLSIIGSGDTTAPDTNAPVVGTAASSDCQLGSDANAREDCRIVGIV